MQLLRMQVAMALVAAAATAARAHDDVVPYALGGKIVTGGHDDLAGTNTIETRVFGYDFGEDPGDPYVIGDPGFNNGSFAVGLFPGDGLLPTNSTLAFNVVTNLTYWDGTGSVAFTPAAAGVALGLNRGSFTVVVDAVGQSGTTPTIGGTGASGRVHVHLESQLRYTDGTDPTPPNAPEGIYLVGLELTLPGLANSDPLYILYNNGLSEELHDEAMDWARTALVPEPASWMLAAVATVAISVCVRRARRLRWLA